jgi:hypothetical protein
MALSAEALIPLTQVRLHVVAAWGIAPRFSSDFLG